MNIDELATDGQMPISIEAQSTFRQVHIDSQDFIVGLDDSLPVCLLDLVRAAPHLPDEAKDNWVDVISRIADCPNCKWDLNTDLLAFMITYCPAHTYCTDTGLRVSADAHSFKNVDPHLFAAWVNSIRRRYRFKKEPNP